MPRLPHSLLLRAARQSRHLRSLLPECRDLQSARNELRWLAEHAQATHQRSGHRSRAVLFARYVQRRSLGVPLQYIIGNQPFGDLEILCKPGVLIPRPDTESYVQDIGASVNQLRDDGIFNETALKILDLCTGTGCIALLLHNLLNSYSTSTQTPQRMQITAVDISKTALRLAQRNLHHNIRLGALRPHAIQDVLLLQADILASSGTLKNRINFDPFYPGRQDIIISNPPYISLLDYAPGGQTSRSVRRFEPKLALVPPALLTSPVDQADVFYEKILEMGRDSKAKLICMEVGDTSQANRIAALAYRSYHGLEKGVRPVSVEIWCDDGTILPATDHENSRQARQDQRAVVIWTDDWARWRSSNSPIQSRDA